MQAVSNRSGPVDSSFHWEVKYKEYFLIKLLRDLYERTLDWMDKLKALTKFMQHD